MQEFIFNWICNYEGVTLPTASFLMSAVRKQLRDSSQKLFSFQVYLITYTRCWQHQEFTHSLMAYSNNKLNSPSYLPGVAVALAKEYPEATIVISSIQSLNSVHASIKDILGETIDEETPKYANVTDATKHYSN